MLLIHWFVCDIIAMLIGQYSFSGRLRYSGQPAEVVTADSSALITGNLSHLMVDASSWPELPHVAFANLWEDLKAAMDFTKRYGPLMGLQRSLGEGWNAVVDGRTAVEAAALNLRQLQNLRNFEVPVSGTFSFGYSKFLAAQKELRLAWRGEQSSLAGFRHGLSSANSFRVFPFPHPKLEGIGLRTDELLDFIRLSFLMDYDTGRAGVCANARCRKPYFLKQRADQECCSHRCAVERNNTRMAARRRAKKPRRRL
jgi:hypothetical protein